MRRRRRTSWQERHQFVQEVPRIKLIWLERVDPSYIWVLKEFYSFASTTDFQLAKRSPWSHTSIISRKEQALYLLGYEKEYLEKYQRAADRRVVEFGARQKLAYLLRHGELAPIERLIARKALYYRAQKDEIARHSEFRDDEVWAVLNRILARVELKVWDLGCRVRNSMFRDSIAKERNLKAEFEAMLLARLSRGESLSSYARELGIDQAAIGPLVAEVRLELVNSAEIRLRYNQLVARSQASGGSPTHQIMRLNQQLLPLYTEWRQQNTPFSERELAYLNARINGMPGCDAAKNVLEIDKRHASVIEQAFFGLIGPRPEVSFPESMDLPPFTKEQRALMRRLNYCRLY